MEFKNEADLVRAFGAAIDSWPTSTLVEGAGNIVIFAHELNLEGAGPNGNAGSADIVAVDDAGEIWVIEAKLRRNPQSNPYYVFGNQLARYANGLCHSSLTDLHRHIQDYAYGRRSVLTPPDNLAESWQNIRDLEGMLDQWMKQIPGGSYQSGKELVQKMESRIRSGRFVLALLTDDPTPKQREWVSENAKDFESAVLTINTAGKIQLVCRTEPRSHLLMDQLSSVDLPPFDRIPQSFNPAPESFGTVLNDTAFQLFTEVALPALTESFGVEETLKPRRSTRSGASFGYCIKNRLGLPLTLMFGRGDHRLHKGAISPGEHTLKLDVNLKWACAALEDLSGNEKDAAIEDLWSLYSQLKDIAQYGIKNSSSVRDLEAVGRDLFDQQLEKGDLRLERWLNGGKKDFGNTEQDYLRDAKALEAVLKTVLSFCPVPPYELIDRPKRSRQKKEPPNKVKVTPVPKLEVEIKGPQREALPPSQTPVTDREVLNRLCLSEGHPGSSSFSVLSSPKKEAAQSDYWAHDGVKGHSVSPRSRAYLAAYWVLSDSGNKFYLTGIPIENGYLIPDKAVMKRFLRDGFISISHAEKKFILLDRGQGLVDQVLTRAEKNVTLG